MVVSSGGVMHSNGSVYGNETSDGIAEAAADSTPDTESPNNFTVEDEHELPAPFELPTVAFGVIAVDATVFFETFCSNWKRLINIRISE